MLGGIRRIWATRFRISPIVVLGSTSRAMGSLPPIAGTTSIRILTTNYFLTGFNLRRVIRFRQIGQVPFIFTHSAKCR